jgi:hypothetical protein
VPIAFPPCRENEDGPIFRYSKKGFQEKNGKKIDAPKA